MEIKGKVHYVGVNDRTKALFENLWPLPYGVSYNSYLIADDDMVALVDTVDVAFFEQYLKKIRSVIGDRKIDYLIINHMEPDHSGAIALIKQYYPEIVLVGNKKTFDMVEGYYGVTGERYVVGDGDFLKLGHHNLRFYLVPMVHWPETMVTYDETERNAPLLCKYRGQVRQSGTEGFAEMQRTGHPDHLSDSRTGVGRKDSSGSGNV